MINGKHICGCLPLPRYFSRSDMWNTRRERTEATGIFCNRAIASIWICMHGCASIVAEEQTKFGGAFKPPPANHRRQHQKGVAEYLLSFLFQDQQSIFREAKFSLLVQYSPKRNKSIEIQQSKLEAASAVCSSNPFVILQSDDAMPTEASSIDYCYAILTNARCAAVTKGEPSCELVLLLQNDIILDGDVEAKLMGGRAGSFVPQDPSDIKDPSVEDPTVLQIQDKRSVQQIYGRQNQIPVEGQPGVAYPDLPCFESRMTILRWKVRQAMEAVGEGIQCDTSVKAGSSSLEGGNSSSRPAKSGVDNMIEVMLMDVELKVEVLNGHAAIWPRCKSAEMLYEGAKGLWSKWQWCLMDALYGQAP
ncbi:hypothetical protein Nepgr_010359 [Nepenthes gracilis]|uniref:Uncharacterized protein n=1 Tax=Nepenthes gracilis TaxID=150966 RepID=A0AAD3XL90_NEPGR|nr:hypothetical protein Nepgr_010359 [Nepenthes gracilis]